MNKKERKLLNSFTSFDELLLNDYIKDKDAASFLQCLKPLIELQGNITLIFAQITLPLREGRNL